MRFSLCQRTARASAKHSTCLPHAARASADIVQHQGIPTCLCEADTHEELASVRIVELLALENRAPTRDQELCDREDDPRPVVARQGEHPLPLLLTVHDA